MTDREISDAAPPVVEGIRGARVLVTAGAAGIGRRIAECFLAHGAHVFLCDVDRAALTQAPDGAVTRHCDVADAADVARMVAAAQDALGGLDSVIATAGIAGPTGPIEETDAADWRRCVEVNLFGAANCARHTLPILKAQGSGSLILFSSTAGLYGFALRSPYCAAKWGIIGLAKALAAEAGPHGVRVNAICPGAVDGARMDRVIAAEAAARNLTEDAIRRSYTDGTALQTFVDADDLAQLILFLTSRAGRRITGQAITVDGGTNML